MWYWILAPLVAIVFVIADAGACGSSGRDFEPSTHPCVTPNDNPNPFDTGGGSTRNPAIVTLCTDSPTPVPTPTPAVTEYSPTPISNNSGAWLHKLGTYTHQLRRTRDQAAQAYPNFAANPADTAGYAGAFDEAGQPASGINALRPAPAGLETQYAALNTKLTALLAAVRTYPLVATNIVTAQADYVAACTSIQQYANANSLEADLRCSGPIKPLSAADFVAAVAPVITKMHTDVDKVQATFDAFSSAEKADFNNLSIYASGIANAFGLAAQNATDPAPPASLAAPQQTFVVAATALQTAGVDLEVQAKSIDPSGLPALAASAPTTLAPLEAAVETACSQLQAAATSAGVTTNLGCRSS